MSFSILTICHHTFTAFCIEKQGEVRKSIIDALKSVQTTPVGSSTNGAMKDLKLEEGKKVITEETKKLTSAALY